MIFAGDKNTWNKEVALHPSFLQSWQWGELQKKLGRRVFRLEAGRFLASLIEQNLPLGQTYLYAPHGPVVREPAAGGWLEFIDEIKKLEGLKKPLFVRIEPLFKEFRGEPLEKVLIQAGFRRTKPVQPETTLAIDLKRDEKEILAGMEHDTRYSIRAAEKRGVAVEFLEGEEKKTNFEIFWEIFSETNKRHDLKAYPKAYYEEVAAMEGECSSKIAVARVEGEAISAAMFVYFDERAFYLFAGSLPGYGKYNAPTYLLWRAMLEAKNAGCRWFDFWGISRKNKNWARITAFKKSFGGEEISSIGTWDYVFNKPLYFIYNLSKRLK